MKPLSDASCRLCATLLALMLFASLSFAGQTGKISGRVIDSQTREPLPGASVVIEGTHFGAATDPDGYYHILNVLPGTYTISVSAVGYQRMIIKNVQVQIDLTTAIDAKLNPSTIDMTEVVTTAERPLVQKDLTSTSVTVSSDEIKLMPVENVDQVINLQAGVIGGHFRGGRTNEVLYLVDGVSVTDAFNNTRGLTVENSSIRQMEVISGAFNAEYGQAMSGVVNIVTQEGSSAFHGSLSGYVGDYFTSHAGTSQDNLDPNVSVEENYARMTTHTGTFEGLDQRSAPRTKNVEGTLSGPIFVDGLTFFAAGRYLDETGYLYGRRFFQPSSSNPYQPYGTDPRFPVSNGEYVSMNPSTRASGTGKITYNSGSFKVSVGANYEHGWNKYYDHAYKWVPDGVGNNYHTSQMYNLQLTHTFSPSTYHSLKYSYNFFDYRGYLYRDLFDPRYVDPHNGDPQSSYTFRSGGNYAGRYERNTMMHLIQYAITSQLSKEHKVTFGAEAQIYKIYNHGYNLVNLTQDQYDSLGNPIFTLGYPKLGSLENQAYDKKPRQFAAYLQDKIEYDIMIINAGVRFDYFNPRASYPADLKNPDGNPAFPGAGQTVPATKKIQVSPRLGISFPITDEGIIHFSYGHFFQMPGFGNLYQNPDFLVSSAGQLSTITGNPNLDAQRTVSYEVGLQQVLFGILSLDVSAYYRDIRNYLGTEIIGMYDGREYALYINKDYANVRGFVVSAEKRFANWFSLRADYTFQIAEGNSSDPLTEFNNNQTDPPVETPKTVVPLDWDQRHTLNLNLMVGKPGDWTTSLIFQYGSGYPYTEDVRTSKGLTFQNEGNKPPFYNLDLRIDKSFPLLGVNLNTFLWVYNLLDIKNELNVDPSTGRANMDLYTSLGGTIHGINTLEQYLDNPTSFSAPREVRLGLSVEF